MSGTVQSPHLYQSLKVLVDDVNSQPRLDRYSHLCACLSLMFESLKIDIDDKHDALADISDFMDGLKPSPRSRLPINKKRT